MSILATCLTIFAPTLFIASIGLFINYGAKCIQNTIVICFITETVGEGRRGKDIMVVYFFYAIGVASNGLVFYVFRSWQLALFLYQIVPFIVIIIGVFMFIEETPFDLAVFCSPEQNLEALERIALRNGRQDSHGLSLEEVALVSKEYLDNELNKHDYAFSVIDLFRFKSLQTISIISVVIHFFISFEFNAPEMVLNDFAMNIYFNGVIIGFSEIFASVYCYFLVNNTQRKKAIYVTSTLGLAVACFVLLFASCSSGEECG